MMMHAATTTPNDAAREPDSITSGVSVQRIQAEYVEMPGLTLTAPQAARLWNTNVHASEQLLAGLVDQGFLMRDDRGAYRRRGCPRCC